MRLTWRILICFSCLGLPFAQAADWQVPIASKTLKNGLVVVVSSDHSSPTVGISVVYKVGMRLEPKDRTGFAHLFEHLMFEGTPNSPSGTFDKVIQGGGGVLNGSTRADFTNYISSAPVSALEPILWLEADRMKSLDFNEANLKNQQDVVKEEIRVNVQNRPYGLFFWTDLNRLAFTRWANAHDGYGSFEDLASAKLDDVRSFHRDYYGPNNAVLGLAGDLTAEQGFALAEKYFAAIPRRDTPAAPDVDEPLNTANNKTERQTDALARAPALAVGWKAPARGSADQAAMSVLTQLLLGDDASRLYLALVKGKSLALNVQGGVNWPLGGNWDYDGPTLFTIFTIYKPGVSDTDVLTAIEAEIAEIAKNGADDATLKRTKTRMRAALLGSLESYLSRADAIAKTQAIWGDAAQINARPALIAAVTSEDLKRVAGKYFVPANRAVIVREPVPTTPSAPGDKS